MESHYCWRCQTEVPMLDEAEWAEIAPFLDEQILTTKGVRDTHGISLADARTAVIGMACAAFERLTGYRETNYLAIYHHRLSIHGAPCGNCGRLLRTPRAKFCASCGWCPKIKVKC